MAEKDRGAALMKQLFSVGLLAILGIALISSEGLSKLVFASTKRIEPVAVRESLEQAFYCVVSLGLIYLIYLVAVFRT